MVRHNQFSSKKEVLDGALGSGNALANERSASLRSE
jgi:hypothetical protein